MSRQMTTSGPTRTAPRWAGDFGSREHVMPVPAQVDPAQFRAEDAVQVVVGAAGAAQGATAVPVDALSGPIPSGTVLDFGGAKFARLTAAAAAGATSITVAALPTALVDNDAAWYAGVKTVAVPSGTAIGRTIAERDLSTPYGPAASTDDEIFLVMWENPDVNHIADVELYRPGSVVYENYLPGWSALPTALQDEIRARYQCVRMTE